MKKQETIAIQAYNILKDIPNKEWCTNQFVNKTEKKCCAFGHINRIAKHLDYDKDDYNLFTSSDLGNKLANLVFGNLGINLANVNDGIFSAVISRFATETSRQTFDKYNKLKTPKGRVIELLKDMIKAGL